MILGRVGQTVLEDFTVADSSNNLVSGIDSTSFIVHLFDPSGNEVSSSSNVTISELGYGHYRSQLIPTTVGMWYMVAYHPTYFNWGKSGSIQVFSNDFDTITTLLTRVLGLTQENFYIDNTVYDENQSLTSGRIRIYSDATSVGSNNNITATYNITTTYTDNKMDTYKVEKV
jgi:hypothetical protein